MLKKILGTCCALAWAIWSAIPAAGSTPGQNGALLFVGPGISSDSAPDPLLDLPGAERDLEVSADGRSIVFALVGTDGDWDIHRATSNGSNPRRLTNTDASDSSPTWSPDGRFIAFDRVPESAAYSRIWVMGSDGSNPRPITPRVNGRFDSLPDWSPDGRTIAFVSDRDGDAEIYLMDRDGSDVRRFTQNGTADTYPDWSPDGKRLAWHSGAFNGVGGGIAVRSLAGGQILNLTAGETGGQNHASWSPDGTMVAYARGSEFLRARPAAGGPFIELVQQDPGQERAFPVWVPRCSISGDNGANTLNGTAKSELICAKGGNDRVSARGGLDIVLLGAGADTGNGGGGNDVIIGGRGNDRLRGSKGNDLLLGQGGDDSMDGGAGDDVCVQGAGSGPKTSC